MKSFLAIFGLYAILAGIHARVPTSDYCGKSCEDPFRPNTFIKHIACGYDGKFKPAPHCISPKWVEITDKLKTLIVNLHNEERNLVAGGGAKHLPIACKMATMSYDDTLQKHAEALIATCKYDHDKCHYTSQFLHSGQNLYALYRSTNTFDDEEVFRKAIKSWAEEKKDTNRANIKSYPLKSDKAIGHFTALVNDRSTHVGCAAATMKDGEYNMYYIACNYASTNIIEKKIYNSDCDSPAKACVTGKNPKYKNLCSEKEVVNPNEY